ncbi:MAG: TVP38/TMEM64 family protein [Alphaproteobacteria bacterium]|nr:MAG: TVP38/TMEM64 family protein [Alphaproteobacteria bacterium]
MKKWIPLIIIGLLVTGFWLSGLGQYTTLENFQTHKSDLLAYVADHHIQSLVIFGLVYITATALSLPIASLLTFIGGFLFGVVYGSAIVAICATIGATIIFKVAQSSIGTALRSKAGGLYKRVEKDMETNAFSYLLFLRLVPLFPFFLINILPALFNVRTSTYIITTFIGILPGTIVYVNVGRQLGTIENPADLISPHMILAISLLGVFALVPMLYQKFKTQ